MHRFKKILFVGQPPAHAPDALQQAVTIARSSGARVTSVDVVEDLQRSLTAVPERILIQQMQKSLTQERLAQTRELSERFEQEGVEVKTKILVGTPFIEIIREVIKGSHDLVIKPTEGRSGLSARLLGSTDLHLLRKCPCPVWIVKPSKRNELGPILAAVDPDPSEQENAELNRLILDLATSLAAGEQSELHIVHAWRMSGESTLRSARARMASDEVVKLVSQTRDAHKRWLDELTAQYPLQELRCEVHLLKGEAGEVIPALAKKKGIALIVMGTVARTGIPGFIIGNTAEHILAGVDCSVLAVKPKGFVTPVKA